MFTVGRESHSSNEFRFVMMVLYPISLPFERSSYVFKDLLGLTCGDQSVRLGGHKASVIVSHRSQNISHFVSIGKLNCIGTLTTCTLSEGDDTLAVISPGNFINFSAEDSELFQYFDLSSVLGDLHMPCHTSSISENILVVATRSLCTRTDVVRGCSRPAE